MYWKEYFDLTIEIFSWNHIDTTINKNKEDEWRFTSFYGETNTQKRHELWAHLRSLKNCGNAPWLYAGDFNEITRQYEKCGGRVGPHSQMQPFRDILDECGFMDMGFVGSQFTWHKHFVDYTVWERLDRIVATNDWFNLFPNTKIHHLDMTSSNHKPLLIVPDGMECRFQKPFCFDQMWMSNKGYSDTIEAVWRQGEPKPFATRLIKRVKKCGQELTHGIKRCFGSVRRDLEKK